MKFKFKMPYALRSLTVKWNIFVGTVAAVWPSIQDAMPEIKAVLEPRWVVAFVVANALIGVWLRSRTDKPLDAYKPAAPTATDTGQKEAGQ